MSQEVLKACTSWTGLPKAYFPQSQENMNIEGEREGSPGNKEIDVKKIVIRQTVRITDRPPSARLCPRALHTSLVKEVRETSGLTIKLLWPHLGVLL